MKIQLLTIGGLKMEYARIGCALFTKRLNSLCRFECIELPDAHRKKKGNPKHWKKEEGQRILKALGSCSAWVALDEKGAQYTSQKWAQWIQKIQNQSYSRLCFVIGGPDGLDQDILNRAPYTLSLGAMTLPHELARLLLLEQLYRAHAILNHLPYHRD